MQTDAQPVTGFQTHTLLRTPLTRSLLCLQLSSLKHGDVSSSHARRHSLARWQSRPDPYTIPSVSVYTRRWWRIMAVGAQPAAVECILKQDPPIPVPNGAPPLAETFHWADIAPEPSRLLDQGQPWKRGQHCKEAMMISFYTHCISTIIFFNVGFPLIVSF